MNSSYREKKVAWMTGAIIVLNVLYFLFLEMAGSSEDGLTMIRYGALYTPLVLGAGEYYRLVTSVFMHFGIRHLVNNMLVLFVLGDNLERALGKGWYLVFYLLCGIGANAVSLIRYMETAPNVVSAGASGAIFGVVGGLIYIVAVNRGRLEDLSTRQLVIMAVFSLYLGFTSSGTNNAAHISGIVIGFLLAAVLYRKPGTMRNEKSGIRRNENDER